MNEQDVQIIEKDGKPEYVVVPIEAYRRMVAALEDAADSTRLSSGHGPRTRSARRSRAKS